MRQADEVLASGTPTPSEESKAQQDCAKQNDAAAAQNKGITRQRVQKYTSEFTFHPRVSSASSRIVENSGMDFITRQNRHVEKQKKLLEENKALYQDVGNSQVDSKRPKIAGNNVRSSMSMERPGTGDKNLLKKRNRMPRNKLRQRLLDERMETQLPASPLPSSSSPPPSLPPRAKTYHSLSQSMVASGIYGTGNVRKKNSVDPYANFDRLQRAKHMAEKAIKSKKIFSIHGPYPLIRKALRERGWVEKEFKLPPRLKNNNRHGDSSDIDDVDDDDDYDDDADQKDSGIGMSPRPPFEGSECERDKDNEDDDCYGIMGRMARNEVPVFQWTTRTSSIDWKTLQKDQIVNHFAKANFTTKVGLCMNMRMLTCFAEGHSGTFFPRCYRLSNEDEKMDFIDDFRLTTAVSILKIVVARHTDDNYGQNCNKVENGQMPPLGGPHIVPTDILQVALQACDLHVRERENDDIDQDECVFHIPDATWDQMIFHYMKLAHDGAMIAHSGSYFKQCEQALEKMKTLNPQFFIEGVKNTWIVKPGAKSRGRGILVMNRLDEILKLVSGDPNLIKDGRWVVQKYIERPLLVHETKFDVRQWFLVSDWNPLVIWIYKESYLRFSSRPFTLKQLDASIHLCNYSVQKNFEIDSSRHPNVPADNMWSDSDFREYLRTRGCHTLWEDLVFPGIKKAIIHICQTALDVVEYRKGSFELYGADFMIDENYNPWLIEVNSSPTMARSTHITSKLCASVQEDVLKVVLDRKRDKNCDIGLFEMIYKQPAVDVPLYVGKALNVEGVTVKKPNTNPIRRTWSNASAVNLGTNTRTSVLRSEVNKENASTIGRAVSKTASIYGQSITNRVAKVSVRSNNLASGPQSRAMPNRDSRQSSRLLIERPGSPAKLKMQCTLKRLTNEVNNTPSKPNAFNLRKPPGSSTTGGNIENSGNGYSVSTQTSTTKLGSHFQTRVNHNGSLYTVKLPSATEGNNTTASNGTVHFVSSSQAKAASTMGIMNFGTSYNGMIAAANRGCFPGKTAHMPYPPPQAVVPKTFPASSLAGGELLAGGETNVHPPPPPGVITLTPQTIGLTLPFQRFFAVDHTGTHGPHQRRNVAYGGVPDVRLGATTRPRVSGIHEWLRRQQCESGLSVCRYDTTEDERLAAVGNDHPLADLSPCAECSNTVCACNTNDNNEPIATNGRVKVSAPAANTYKYSHEPRRHNENPRPPGRPRQSVLTPGSSPFKSTLAIKTRRRSLLSKSAVVSSSVEDCLKSLDHIPALTSNKHRRHTAGHVLSGKKKRPVTPSFVHRLFSLKYRHDRGMKHKKEAFLAVSCPNIKPVST